jgi:hypothetical protein
MYNPGYYRVEAGMRNSQRLDVVRGSLLLDQEKPIMLDSVDGLQVFNSLKIESDTEMRLN